MGGISLPDYNEVQYKTPFQSRVDRMAGIHESMLRLYEDKNADYGDSFRLLRDEFGPTSTMIRLQDKLNRLKSLHSTRGIARVKDESLFDTLTDLANYAIMEIMYMQEELENAEDARTPNCAR